MIKKFILASASEGRKALLQRIGFVPDVILAADIDESRRKKEKPRDLAIRLAQQKAQAIAQKHPEAIILAADSVAVAAGKILEKTSDPEMERKYLNLISGRRHRIYTSVCVRQGEIIKQKTVMSVMKFKRLSHQEIETYVANGEWKGKAGGYSIEGIAESFISFMSGSHSNIIGLPLYEARNLLLSFGLEEKW
jgi:septum formation protein